MLSEEPQGTLLCVVDFFFAVSSDHCYCFFSVLLNKYLRLILEYYLSIVPIRACKEVSCIQYVILQFLTAF